MRSSLKLVCAVVTTAVTVLGGSALASSPHSGGTQTPQVCGTGTVSTDAPVTLWPPNHKAHTYNVTYSGGATGDTLSTTTTSSDGNGVVSDSAPATVGDPAGDVSTQSTVKAERSGPNRAGRTYTMTYTVTGSNNCSSSFTVTVPHDRRKTA